MTGAKSRRAGLPCYTFADNGEGQAPQDFKSTFLSLSTGNKKDIPFVQGKYNMGSSGVLGYCGLKWFKLIVSRRYDRSGPWGFTLMRKRPGGGMPVAEYFVLPDGKIPSFDEDALYPFMKGDGRRYQGVHLASGTVIKLYDYQIPSRFQTGFRGTREALNENLVETILPFLILDFRQTPDPKRSGYRAEGNDDRSFYGMEYLLLSAHKDRSDSDAGDDDDSEASGLGRIAVANIKTEELGEIVISAIKLKRALPEWLKPTKTRNRVFHAVNGQVQFKETRGYLSQSCGFPALKDRVVVIVDASDLTFEAHNEVWKGDREHVRNTIIGERYQDVVTTAIKTSQALIDLQNEVAREELEQAAKTGRDHLFQKLVETDPNLAALLTDKDPVIVLPSKGAGDSGGDDGSKEFEGKYSPTFLKFEGKARETGVVLPINRTRPVAARTDAENGYLQRDDNTGTLVVDPAIFARFGLNSQLHNGRLTIYLDPVPGAVQIGDQIVLKVGLQDASMPQPVEDSIMVRITEEADSRTRKNTTKRTKPAAGDKGENEGTGKPTPTHGLPRHRLMTEDGRKVGTQESIARPE